MAEIEKKLQKKNVISITNEAGEYQDIDLNGKNGSELRGFYEQTLRFKEDLVKLKTKIKGLNNFAD